MNSIRKKIVGFWLLFFLFCLLLWFSWRHRLLWIALFGSASVVLGLIKPRLSPPPPKLRALFWLAVTVFGLTVFFHGILYPSSGQALLAGEARVRGNDGSGTLLEGLPGLSRLQGITERQRRTRRSAGRRPHDAFRRFGS
jgi:hypothetical protein